MYVSITFYLYYKNANKLLQYVKLYIYSYFMKGVIVCGMKNRLMRSV